MKKFFTKKRRLLFLGSMLFFLFGICFFCFKNHFISSDTRFQRFTDKLFENELSSNTLNLHYTLAKPENYGIKEATISLGDLSPENFQKRKEELQQLQKNLSSFTPEKLSKENQMIYDILKLSFATQLSVADDYLLTEPLGPNLGIQAQLPVLLAEYTFRSPDDIKDYFALLSSIPEYFKSIIKFEKEKSLKGLFMSDTTADRIIQQCNSFTDSSEENYLHTMFQERVQKLQEEKQINKKQVSSYIKMHQKLLKEFVFPSYHLLAQELDDLKGTGKNENGLSHLPGGKSYYAYLIKNDVGDYRSVSEIEKDLYQRLLQYYNDVQKLSQENPDLLKTLKAETTGEIIEPEKILTYLQKKITNDFPSLTVKDYEVKYVPKAMEEFSSPAFYLTPPIDTLTPNTIYINKSSSVSCPELFTTLAHEGFPGHLYQTLYFGNQGASPIRSCLSCSGYIEGWATFVEDRSYKYGAEFLKISPTSMEFLRLNRCISLCLYSLLDIGIHDKGWNFTAVSEILSSFGVTEEDVCHEIFQYIVENPANYLKYYLGFLNFSSLENTIRELEGDAFDLKKFHKNVLEIGPAPFPVLKKYLLMKY
mgnify:FL=1